MLGKQLFRKEGWKIKDYLNGKSSGKPIETTDKKVHNIQLTKVGKKKTKTSMATIDFINIKGQQNFEEEAVINQIEIIIKKRENSKHVWQI